MDSDLLVEMKTKVEDGQRLINSLIRQQFDVAVAFWGKMNEDSLWELWLASSAVGSTHVGGGLGIVYAAIDAIPGCSIRPLEINVVAASHPVALAAAALRDRYYSRSPVRYREKRLGNLTFDELVVYPRRFPQEVRELDGRWEVQVSEVDDLWLACDSEAEARAVAAARVLEYEALAQIRSSPEFAGELEETANVMEKYRMGFGSRFLRRRAQEIREKQQTGEPTVPSPSEEVA